MPRRILLVGDFANGGDALEQLLRNEDFEIVGRTADTPSGLEVARNLNPDFVIVALDAERHAVVTRLHAMVAACPATRFIGIGATRTRGGLEQVFRAGLRGYVVQARAAVDLLRALRDVGRGEVFLSPHASGALVDPYR